MKNTQQNQEGDDAEQQRLFEDVMALVRESHQPVESALPKPNRWALVIDDDPAFQSVVSKVLEEEGFGVVRAEEGMRGLSAAYHKPADVIILDLYLPNGSGEYVLSRLKSEPLTKNIPVIIVTGERDASMKKEIMAMGACEYLTKPVDFEQLRNIIRLYG